MTSRTVIVSYALGVLLTFAVVSASAWRVSRMNIVTAIRNLPEPPARKQPRNRWLLGLAGVVLGGLLIASGISGRNAITLGFGVSLARHRARARVRAAGRSQPGGAHGGGACTRRLVRAADGPLALRHPERGLLDLHPLRDHDRARRQLDAHVQRRSPAGGALADAGPDPRPRAGAQDVDGVPAAQPVPDGRHPGDVHPGRVHARDRCDDDHVVRERRERPRHLWRRIRHPRDHRPDAADPRHADRPAARPRHRRGRLPRRLGAVVHAGQGAPGRHRRALRGLRRPRGRLGVPHPHDLRPLRARVRVRVRRSGVARAERPRRARGRGSVAGAAQVELQLRGGAALPAEGLLPRGQALRAGVRRRPRPADRPARAPHGDRRALRHRSARDGRHRHVAAHARVPVRRPGRPDRVPVRACATASMPRPRRSTSSRPSSQTACRPTRCRSCSQTPWARRSPSTG